MWLTYSIALRSTPVKKHFTWFIKKVHRPPQYLETFRLAMDFKIPLRIPFFQQAENIFILQAVKKITAQAALFRPDAFEQRGNCLGQFLAFLGGHLHVHNDHDHNTRVKAKGMPQAKAGRNICESLY